MKKTALIMVVMLLLISGCTAKKQSTDTSSVASKATEKTTIHLSAMTNDTGVILADLMKKNISCDAKNRYVINLHTGKKQLEEKMNEEPQITLLSVEDALEISKSTNNTYKIFAVVQQNNIYAFSKNTVEKKNFAEMTVAAYESDIIKAALKEIGCENYTLLSSKDECENAAKNNKYDIIIAPMPIGGNIKANENFKVETALNTIAGKDLTTGCIISTTEMYITMKDAVKNLKTDIQSSIKENGKASQATLDMLINYGICDKAVAADAAKLSGGLYVDGADAKTAIENYISLCELQDDYKNTDDYVING